MRKLESSDKIKKPTLTAKPYRKDLKSGLKQEIGKESKNIKGAKLSKYFKGVSFKQK